MYVSGGSTQRPPYKVDFIQTPSFSEGSNEIFIKNINKMYFFFLSHIRTDGGGGSEIREHVPYKDDFYALLSKKNILYRFIKMQSIVFFKCLRRSIIFKHCVYFFLMNQKSVPTAIKLTCSNLSWRGGV